MKRLLLFFLLGIFVFQTQAQNLICHFNTSNVVGPNGYGTHHPLIKNNYTTGVAAMAFTFTFNTIDDAHLDVGRVTFTPVGQLQWCYYDQIGNMHGIEWADIAYFGEPSFSMSFNYDVYYIGNAVHSGSASFNNKYLSATSGNETQFDLGVTPDMHPGKTPQDAMHFLRIEVTNLNFNWDGTILQGTMNKIIDGYAKLYLDPALENLFKQLDEAVAAGDNNRIQNIKAQILEMTEQAYPDKINEIKDRINAAIAKGSTPKPKPATTTKADDKEKDFPEGWTYLKQYQKLLNDYANECNRAANGDDPSRLIDMATNLSEWVTKYTEVFSQFTSAQMDALTKMSEYFANAMMNCANASTDRLKNISFADDGEKQDQGNFVPDIKTKPVTTTPGSSTTPSSSGDGTFEKGSINVKDAAPSCTPGFGTNGYKRPQQ